MHYHLCPTCLEKYNCEQDCTLKDALNQLGVNVVCPLCEDDEAPKEKTTELIQQFIKVVNAEEPTTPEMTQEDWDRYNGFIR